MAKLIWTDEAIACLRAIRDYIAKNSEEASFRVANGIYKKSEILQNFPQLGYLHDTGDEGEIRVLIYGHYRIVYIYDDQVVHVVGVYHGAMNANGKY